MFENLFDPFFEERQRQAQAEQAAAQAVAAGQQVPAGPEFQAMAPEERQGWLDAAYENSLGGLAWIGKTLDKYTGARAIRGGLNYLMTGENPSEMFSTLPFTDTFGVTEQKNAVQGTDLLDTAGLTDRGADTWGRTLAGVGLEMALDPSTYATFGAPTAAGKLAVKAGTATKGLGAGIRAGERGLIGFGLPFAEPAESLIFGTGARAADFADAVPRVAGNMIDYPVRGAEWLAEFGAGKAPPPGALGLPGAPPPQEAYLTRLFGQNPVTAMREGANTLGRMGRTWFEPEVAGATTREVQPLGREFTAGKEAAMQPYANTWAEALVKLDPLMKRGPDEERAVLEGIRLALEVPKDPQPYLAAAAKSYSDTVAELGGQLSAGQIGQQAFDDGVRAAEGLRDDTIQRIAQQRVYAANKIGAADYQGLFNPSEVAMLDAQVGNLANAFGKMRLGEQSLGLNSAGIDDIIGYGTRQKQSLPRGAGEGMWNFIGRRGREGSAAFDETQKMREEIFRGIPGGTTQIDELFKNPALRAMKRDDLEGYLRATLTGSVTPPANFPAWDQAAKMADAIQTSDARYAKEGLDFFSKDVLDAFKLKAGTHAKRMSLGQTVLTGVEKFAKPAAHWAGQGRSGIPVEDVLNKAGFVPGGAGYNAAASRLGLPNPARLKGLTVPEDVAADMLRLGEAWRMPESLAPVIQAWDMGLNMFKTGVTTVFPAFHTRNLMSGMFNMWRDNALNTGAMKDSQAVLRGGYLSDATAAKLYPGMTPQQATEALKIELLANHVSMMRETRRLGETLGPTDRLTSVELPMTTGTQKTKTQVLKDTLGLLKPDPKATAAGYSPIRQYADPFAMAGVGADKDVNRFVNTGREIGNNIEDWMRTSHYLAKRLDGYAPGVAAESTAKYHIDYSKATQGEKQILKRIVPWYGFSRGSLPPLLEDLVTRPAKVGQGIRLTSGARDEGEFAPAYIAEGASMPFFGAPEGNARYLSSFGLPFEDDAFKMVGSLGSGNVRRAITQAVGMTAPFPKVLGEIASDTQFYSGRRLSDLQPSQLLSLNGMLPDRLAQGLTQVVANSPAARFVSTADRAMDTRKWDGTGLLNLLSGVRVSDVDLARAKPAAQMQFLREELRPASGSRVREELYFPADQRGKMSAADQLGYDMLLLKQREAAAASRERKAAAGR